MTIADEMGFEERHSGFGYTVVSSYNEGEEIETDGIDDGDNVSLRFSDERVLVRDVSYDDEENIYWGVIYGFEPDIGVEFEGLKIGEEISFREDHVFSCTRV